MIVADRPYFALHYWNGREPRSPISTRPRSHEVLARYGRQAPAAGPHADGRRRRTFSKKRQGMLRMLWKERAEGLRCAGKRRQKTLSQRAPAQPLTRRRR